MKASEQEFLNDLRLLAEDGATGAPPALRERLLIEFRRRHARKRLLARVRIATVGAIAAALLVAWVSGDARRFLTRPDVPAPAMAESTEFDFYPLPEAEGLPPIENATVIRVQMPVASLQLMGLAVNEDNAADPVQADILLGQDGLARGVRLVQ